MDESRDGRRDGCVNGRREKWMDGVNGAGREEEKSMGTQTENKGRTKPVKEEGREEESET